jgi:endonuclease G, mitochondrial
VPSGYFKIVYDKSGGVAFWMGQDSSRNDDYCEKTTSFSNVEKITGIALPKMNVDAKIKKSLGCR